MIAYTIAAWRQLGVMSDQFTEMQKSTTAAVTAANAAQSASPLLPNLSSGRKLSLEKIRDPISLWE